MEHSIEHNIEHSIEHYIEHYIEHSIDHGLSQCPKRVCSTHLPTFRQVTKISPTVAHQAGTLIRVDGSNFAPSTLGGLPVVIYENFTVSDASSAIPGRRSAVRPEPR